MWCSSEILVEWQAVLNIHYSKYQMDLEAQQLPHR
jgi:hypothetical protein